MREITTWVGLQGQRCIEMSPENEASNVIMPEVQTLALAGDPSLTLAAKKPQVL